jgi:hypothetical protein
MPFSSLLVSGEEFEGGLGLCLHVGKGTTRSGPLHLQGLSSCSKMKAICVRPRPRKRGLRNERKKEATHLHYQRLSTDQQSWLCFYVCVPDLPLIRRRLEDALKSSCTPIATVTYENMKVWAYVNQKSLNSSYYGTN